MNEYDVAGVLTTYSQKAMKAKSTEQLIEIVRNLKREFNSEEIRKLTISYDKRRKTTK